MVSASAWRGLEVLAFREMANTLIPLQSLATTVRLENFKPKAAS